MPDVDARRRSVLPYVPELLRAWRPSSPDGRHMQVRGTLADVDISGFTRLTERLARRGDVGAEELSDLLDGTFSALLRDAQAHGGHLVKWGGDAVLLLFTGGQHADRACCASWDMRATLRSAGRLDTSSGTVALRMSVGVHTASFDCYLVGDPQHHRELLLVGPEVGCTVEMESVAGAGQVVLSERTAAQLAARLHRPGPQDGCRLLRGRPDPRATVPVQPTGPAEQGLDEQALGGCLPAVLRERVLAEPGEAEHRSVAVAFVRFSGTDALLRSGGVLAVAEALDECVRNVQQAAHDHGVTFLESDVDRDGGKIMLVAGAPSSAGRDEERLLRAARAVVDRAGVLPLRAGAARGKVFAGDVGPAFRRTYSVKGDTVNLAARLAGVAADGEVLATTAVLDRSPTRFATQELAPFLVKGKARPVTAARVGAVLGSRDGSPTAARFVGRTAELAVLRSALDAAVCGAGGEAEVVGEPGVGKSRLVAELLSGAPGVRVHLGVGREYDATTPYSAFRGLLRTVLGLPHDAVAEQAAARLSEVVAAVAPDLLAWLPLLAIPLDVVLPPTRQTRELDEQYRRSRLEESVERLLVAVSTAPTVLLVEDAHLLDDASCELLARLARRAGQQRWLVLTTRRDTAGGYLPRPGAHLLTVRPGPLAPEESLLLARSAAPTPLTRATAEVLVSRSGGNPMFLEQLVATVGDASTGELPESVQELVASQVDQLAPVRRVVLRYAAVLGAVVELELLEQLLVTSRADVVLADHLPALRRFLDPDGEGRVRFRHAVLRDVAYAGLPYRRRRLLHAHVGAALERTAADPARVSELLSLHYFHAGSYEKAWTYSLVAAARAREKVAHADAIELLQRAVEAAHRAGGHVGDRDVAVALELLGDVRYVAGRSAAAIEAFRLARRRRSGEQVATADLLCKEARTLQRLGRVPQSLRLLRRTLTLLEGVAGRDAHISRANAAIRYAWGRLRQDRFPEALSWGSLAASEAEASGDKATLALAYNAMHSTCYYASADEDVPYARLALLAYEELEDLAGQAHCTNNLGVEALDGGSPAEAADHFARAQESFRRLGDETNQANATYNRADALLRLGHLGQAGSLLGEALEMARAVGDEELVALVLRETGRLCLASGRVEQAREHLADARVRMTALGLVHELRAVEEAEREADALEQAQLGTAR